MNEPAQKWIGKVITKDAEIDRGVVVVGDEQILWVGQLDQLPSQFNDAPVHPLADGAVIIPGLIDVHCHGGGGASFPDSLTIADVTTAANEHLRNGTTTLVASLVTAPLDVLTTRAALLAQATREGIIEGVHYEGPFLSEARCGAQDPRYLIPATPDATQALVDAAAGTAVSMTFAPESAATEDGAKSVEILIEGNILPSWGHTDCDIADAENAISLGVSDIAKKTSPTRGGRASVTHLFNGMRPLHHRDPGPISAFLESAERGGIVLEMINDGVHLDPSLVRKVVELVGRDNCVFVTDAMAAAGMADGQYQLGPQAVRVEDGVARLVNGGAIAGGTARLIDCLRTAVFASGMSLVDAVYLSTVQGARVLGITDRGLLEAGHRADMVVLDQDLGIEVVVRAGEVVN